MRSEEYNSSLLVFGEVLMGNHLAQLLMIIIIGMLSLSSCTVVDDVQDKNQRAMQAQQLQPSQQTQVTGADTPPPVEADIHCPDARDDDCGLIVKLNGQDEPIDVNVRLHIDEGLVFRSDYTEAVDLDDNGNEGRKASVHLMPHESRKILFPYQIDTPGLPGAYRVEIVATNANTLQVFGSTVEHIYIYLDDEGEYHMLSSQNEYANHFINGFVEGLLGVAYNIVLDDKEKPHKGTIFVRIDSNEDDYAPVLELESMGGVEFLSDPSGRNQVSDFGAKVTHSFPMIDEGGARIAQFPFEYIKAGQSSEGVYALITTLKSITGETEKESAPVAISVVADPAYREERWLQEAFIDPYIIDTSVADTSVVNTMAAIGAGGFDTMPTPDAPTAKQLCETKWDGAAFPPGSSKPDWNFSMSDYDGTLCQLYLAKYAGKVCLDWSEFSSVAIANNENISSPDQDLEDHEIYLMPWPSNVP